MESQLEVMLGGAIGVRASGRTDAGVHARGQVVNFYSRTALRVEEIHRGLNSLLPPDIVVLHVEEVPDSFHARFSAVSKTYEYHILNRVVPSALERGFAWHIRRTLSVEPVLECLEMLRGCHDFSAFMGAGSSVNSTERHIYRAELEHRAADLLVFVFEANGFLRHMVRNLVGTLVEVGVGKRTPHEFSSIMVSRNRCRAGMTAPAHGLYLIAVHYESDDRSL
ncbi:tRNA pseudouridine synthase A [Desulforhabdus amnigena]|uniref:tRNA pseudouridine synthase A n=1 Tax=Desulforhabdus amnigena TaxID=40218 RepID=A0A9W6FTS1_9BACT|nr:tRNA pseudouridine synthase A [Desulforhabdus amnigena]